MFSLMYHRISEPDTNPWGVCVSPENFEAQIEWITSRYQVITPTELYQQLQKGKVEKDSVIISFDDGYRDNYMVAKPILEKYHCAATFFIPTYFIGTEVSYWWDELEAIFLHSITLPEEITLFVSGQKTVMQLSGTALSAEDLVLIRRWRWFESAPADRCAAFLRIWEMLRPLRVQQITEQMQMIREWSGAGMKYAGIRLPMSGSELEQMSKQSLFTIALHTHTHPDLAAHSEDEQLREIEQGRSGLIRRGIDSSMLAYPYGRYNDVTTGLVKNLNFDLCFTTKAEEIRDTTDRFQLGRFQAENVAPGDFEKMVPGQSAV